MRTAARRRASRRAAGRAQGLVTTGRRARQARGRARVPVRGGGPDRRHTPKCTTASASQADRGHDVRRALAPVRPAAPAVSLAVVGFRAKGSCGPRSMDARGRATPTSRTLQRRNSLTSIPLFAERGPVPPRLCARRHCPSLSVPLFAFGWQQLTRTHAVPLSAATHASASCVTVCGRDVRIEQHCLQRTLLQTLIMRERRNPATPVCSRPSFSA